MPTLPAGSARGDLADPCLGCPGVGARLADRCRVFFAAAGSSRTGAAFVFAVQAPRASAQRTCSAGKVPCTDPRSPFPLENELCTDARASGTAKMGFWHGENGPCTDARASGAAKMDLAPMRELLARALALAPNEKASRRPAGSFSSRQEPAIRARSATRRWCCRTRSRWRTQKALALAEEAGALRRPSWPQGHPDLTSLEELIDPF